MTVKCKATRLKALLFLLACAAFGACDAAPRVDVVFRGGTIIDGTGRTAYVGDVAVDAGTIAAVGDLGSLRGLQEVDARGLVVAPGFINLHSHAR